MAEAATIEYKQNFAIIKGAQSGLVVCTVFSTGSLKFVLYYENEKAKAKAERYPGKSIGRFEICWW